MGEDVQELEINFLNHRKADYNMAKVDWEKLLAGMHIWPSVSCR